MRKTESKLHKCRAYEKHNIPLQSSGIPIFPYGQGSSVPVTQIT